MLLLKPLFPLLFHNDGKPWNISCHKMSLYIILVIVCFFFVNWHDYVTFSEIWIITCKFNSPVCSVYQKHGTQHKSTYIIFQILSLFRWTKSKPAQYKECNLIRKHSLQLFFSSLTKITCWKPKAKEDFSGLLWFHNISKLTSGFCRKYWLTQLFLSTSNSEWLLHNEKCVT